MRSLESEIEAVLVETDRRISYSMNLVKLVDGDHTYQLKIDGETLLFTDSETPEWNAQERLYEHVAKVKQGVRSRAILALIRDRLLSEEAVEAGAKSLSEFMGTPSTFFTVDPARAALLAAMDRIEATQPVSGEVTDG